LQACNEPKVVNPAPVQRIMGPALTEPERPGAYRIGVGDELEIKFFFTPELNDRITVRPDGKISIMFAQDLQAAGSTAEDLAELIKSKLAPHVKQLDLVVVVRSFASQKVYVGGEVSKPGSIQMSGREDLLQVINDAGWITPAASREQIFVVRRGDNGKDAIYPINLRRILTGEDMSQNVTLQAGDIVMVPPSDVTQADRWVDQNVRQMIPVSTGAFFDVGGR
jgi:protein involved in polysaccharide export with SLBB domain